MVHSWKEIHNIGDADGVGEGLKHGLIICGVPKEGPSREINLLSPAILMESRDPFKLVEVPKPAIHMNA